MDGYNSDASTSTEAGSRTQKAYLVAEGEDGLARRLAFGECRPDEGVFVVDPNGVFEEGINFDIAGIELGSMQGGLLSIDDLDLADLEFEWAEEASLEEEVLHTEADDDASMDEQEQGTSDKPSTSDESDAVRRWRDQACRLEDELQRCRDELESVERELRTVEGQAYAQMLMSCPGANAVRCRVEIPDPGATRTTKARTKLISLEELLSDCHAHG